MVPGPSEGDPFTTAGRLACGMPTDGSTAAGEETAARVTYRSIDRPDRVAEGFAAPDADVGFLSIRALDGNREDAGLVHPRAHAEADTTLVIAVHGVGNNFHTGVPRILATRLPQRGYAVLSIDTRQHDDAANTDNFFDVRRDLEAAVETATALGYRRVALAGHSLGNIHCLFYAATSWHPAIQAVLPLAPFADLPWKTRRILVQDEANYRVLFEEAVERVAVGEPDAVLDTEMGFLRGTTTPVTAQHFLTYRWDVASTASGTYWIRRVPYPVLLVRDANDRIIREFEPYDLLAAATAEGSLVPEVDYVELRNDTDEPGHSFPDNRDALATAITDWLGDHDL